MALSAAELMKKRLELNELSDNELLVELLLEMKVLNSRIDDLFEKCDDIESTIITYSN